MTDLLRQELARLAEDAPSPHPVDLAPDAWRRGRRARRLDRAVVLGVVAAVLVVLGGTASLLVTAPPRIAPAAPVDAPPAVPTELRAVPDHVLAEPASRTADLAIGTQAAVFTSGGLPVAVSATDGSYRILDLPGWSSTDDPPPLSLSPDGTHLAWGRTNGVEVVDLATGARTDREFPASWRGDLDFPTTAVAWSTDSSWVAWGSTVGDRFQETYLQTASVEDDRADEPVFAKGRTALVTGEPGALWVVDETRVAAVGTQPIDFGSFFLGRSLDPGPVGMASPDGTRLAVGSTTPNGAVDVVDLDRKRVRLAYFGGYDEGQTTYAPLGWVGDDTIAVAADVASRGTDVVLVPAPGNGRDGEAVVTRVEDGVADLTVAVDLLDRPTVDRPAPDWPWSELRQRLVLGGAALLVAIAAAAAVAVRRRPAR